MQNIIIVTLLGILLDIVTGFIKALFNKQIDSSVIREGGKHKLGELLIIIFAIYVKKGIIYLNVEIPFNPITLVCTYIILMECISIIENIGSMNNKCIPPKLSGFFKKLSEWKEIEEMKIHELANKDYESIDDIVVDIAESIKEVDELEKAKNTLESENETLKSEVISLKEKNLQLLSLMPTVTETYKDEELEDEEIELEDVLI